MTFKLGDFWVVINQYHNLQIFSKRTGRPASALGPVMICKTKTREQYTALFQAITSKMPALKTSLRAFGRDGENAILEAHTMEFPYSVGFRDSVHIRRNIEEYVKTDEKLSDSFFREVCKDIFGDRQTEGLYHCLTRTEFDNNVEKLKVKWNTMEIKERRERKMQAISQFAK